jgi:hypothetical protein
MDTMRWLISSVATLTLVGVIIGCHHYAGICDCDNGLGCVGCAGTLHPNPMLPPGGRGPEVIKEMPKADDKKSDKKDDKNGDKKDDKPAPDGM